MYLHVYSTCAKVLNDFLVVFCFESSLGASCLCGRDCPVWLSGNAHLYSEQCAVRQRLDETLSSRFHYTSFRPGQMEALMAVAHGSDVFIRMPTGAGKSLCMLLIPLCLGRGSLGIIVSPLIGLIEQQVGGVY